MTTFRLGFAILGLLGATSVNAATIPANVYDLQPNTPNQPIQILITGSEQVASVDFFAQIGDGGPELVNFSQPAGTDAPGVQISVGFPNADIQSGLFSGAPNGGQSDALGGSIPQLIGLSLVLNSGTIAANGVLAKLTIDTTGFFAGSWPMILTGTLAGDTQLLDNTVQPIPLNIGELTLNIVPEPSSLCLAGLAILGLAGDRRRRQLRFASVRRNDELETRT